MSDDSCVICDSNDHVKPNTSNWPEKYYCAHCDRSFNPLRRPCPKCEASHNVIPNPFPDSFDYFCTDCGLVFPRLGPSFDAETIALDEIECGREDSPWRLAFETTELETDAAAAIRIELRNVGTEPVSVQGRTAIAIQVRHDNEWWTLYGNPDRYVPDDRSVLRPGQTLSWTFGYGPSGIAVKDLFVRPGPDYAGEYRFVYWGFEESESVVATRFPIM